MTDLGTWIDYSGGTVSGATMAANGIEGAIRYVGIGGTGKRLTRAEYADHCAHGRQTAAVVEMSTTDADGGYNAGVANAKAAQADLAVECEGLPPILYILAANDKPSFIPADVDYVRGFRDVFGSSAVVGPYGFGSYLAACSAAGLAPIGWQAGPAPSRTGTAGVATWWQRNGGPAVASDGPAAPTTIVLDGIQCDLSNQLLEVPVTAPVDVQAIATAVVNALLFNTNIVGPDGKPTPYNLNEMIYWTNAYANQIPGLTTDVKSGVAQLAAAVQAADADTKATIAAAVKGITAGTVDPTAFAAAVAPLLSAADVAAFKAQFNK